MKTVIIYDQCGEAPPSFFILAGDHTKLDGIYINSTKSNQKLADKFYDLIFNEDGSYKTKPRKKFPIKTVQAGAAVIICGFIP